MEPEGLTNSEQQLRKQIEFYFSDANLLTDKHLVKKIQSSQKSWMPLSYLTRCNKVRNILLGMDLRIRSWRRRIRKVLKDSTLLKIKNQKVKRRRPFKCKR